MAQKVESVMHCNLKAARRCAILSFNYEPRNALAYKFNTYTTSFALRDHITSYGYSDDLWAFKKYLWPYLLHIHKNCYFQASSQNSNTPIRFSDPQFP